MDNTTPSSARSSSTKSSSGGKTWSDEKISCVVIDGSSALSICGAHIGKDKERFCADKKLEGMKHCGVRTHATSTHQKLKVGYIFHIP